MKGVLNGGHNHNHNHRPRKRPSFSAIFDMFGGEEPMVQGMDLEFQEDEAGVSVVLIAFLLFLLRLSFSLSP